MKENQDNLEDKAKNFLEKMIGSDPERKGFNPSKLKNLSECLSEINYLLENGYICEKGDTVGTFHYEFTRKGKSIISIMNYSNFK